MRIHNIDVFNGWINGKIARLDPQPHPAAVKFLRVKLPKFAAADDGASIFPIPLSYRLKLKDAGAWTATCEADRLAKSIVYFRPSYLLNCRVDHVIDWLRARSRAAPPNWNLVGIQNLEIATKMADAYFDAAQLETDARDDFAGHRQVIDFGSTRWIELISLRALKHEGAAMKHCVGHESYWGQVQAGRVRVFALRGADNRSLLTLQLTCGNGGVVEPIIEQTSGPRNSRPAQKHWIFVRILAAHLRAKLAEDVAYAVGMVPLIGTDQVAPLADLESGSVIGGLDLDEFAYVERLPAGLTIEGDLKIGHRSQVRELPTDLRVVGTLDISSSALAALPRGMRVGELKLNGKIAELPTDLVAGKVIVPHGSPVRENWQQLPEVIRRSLISTARAA
jgi:hypothetical protein